VPDISELIKNLARQRSRGDTNPLCLLREFEGTDGQRISHLPVETELAQSWMAFTSQPFRPHQAQALTALRRGEAVALSAVSHHVDVSATLLLYATLLNEDQSAALWLVPDEPTAKAALAHLRDLNSILPPHLRLNASFPEAERRPDLYARIVLVTPEALHSRLLRHHDRAWRTFWPRIRMFLIPDIQQYSGVAGAHLADLILRVHRVTAAHTNRHLSLLATMISCHESSDALQHMLGQAWRLISADDGPSEHTTFALWRGGALRFREAADLAVALRKQAYRVHIVTSALELGLFEPLIGEIDGITWGTLPEDCDVLILAGYPESVSMLQRHIHSDFEAVIAVFGNSVVEQTILQQPEQLLLDSLSHWPIAASNAYVSAQHILCAASELPLTESEVEAWGAQDIVARLVAQNQLVALPDHELSWQPSIHAGDPYSEFSTMAASGGAILTYNQQDQELASLDPTAFERWCFPNAALPPNAAGWRVIEQDTEIGSLVLRFESNGRRTFPLRRSQVYVRDQREGRRLLGGQELGWGRVVIEETVYAYRESTPSGAPADVNLKYPLDSRWTAPACWIELSGLLDDKRKRPMVQQKGQLAGWSLAVALAVRSVAKFTDVVPCYDEQTNRIYLVDAQPGGNGLAWWFYNNAEELLPLAYDVAMACRQDALLEPLSRVDQDWLLTVLSSMKQANTIQTGRRAERAQQVPVEHKVRTETRAASAAQIEFVPAPEPQDDALVELLRAAPVAHEPVAPTPPPAPPARLDKRTARAERLAKLQAETAARRAARAESMFEQDTPVQRGNAMPPTGLQPEEEPTYYEPVSRYDAEAAEPPRVLDEDEVPFIEEQPVRQPTSRSNRRNETQYNSVEEILKNEPVISRGNRRGAQRNEEPEAPAAKLAPSERRDGQKANYNSVEEILKNEPVLSRSNRRQIPEPPREPIVSRSNRRNEPAPEPSREPARNTRRAEPEPLFDDEPAPSRRNERQAPEPTRNTRRNEPEPVRNTRRAEPTPLFDDEPAPSRRNERQTPEPTRNTRRNEPEPAPTRNTRRNEPTPLFDDEPAPSRRNEPVRNTRRAEPTPLFDDEPAPSRRNEPVRNNRKAEPEAPARRQAAAPQRQAPESVRAAPKPAPEPEPEPTPDPAALIARLRQQREEREKKEQRNKPKAKSQRNTTPKISNESVEQRFSADDEIFCLPYGAGVVQKSWVEDGREMLSVEFGTHGTLTIDPAVNFVRKQEQTKPEDDLF
jgi:DEAD/DEAH box helicase domain-containing protein